MASIVRISGWGWKLPRATTKSVPCCLIGSDTLSDPLKLCVYRMVQEALNNANRHAHAKNVVVELKQSANSISVKIEDDGSGFDPKRTRGMGLLGMEERVKRLGGSISIESRPGTRTIIRAELPIETSASANAAPSTTQT